MDKWKDSELERMKVNHRLSSNVSSVRDVGWSLLLPPPPSPQVGGNSPAKEFFSSQPDISPGMTLTEKYNSRTAALYRDKVGTFLPLGWFHFLLLTSSPITHFLFLFHVVMAQLVFP